MPGSRSAEKEEEHARGRESEGERKEEKHARGRESEGERKEEIGVLCVFYFFISFFLSRPAPLSSSSSLAISLLASSTRSP